jgi:hypothetical protein
VNGAQFLLLVLILSIGWFYFTRARAQSSDRILLGLLLGLLTFLIIDPGISTEVANWLGIGRGVDLLLYLFSLFVLFCFALVYLELRNLKSQLTEIVRANAIRDARPAFFPPAPDVDAILET